MYINLAGLHRQHTPIMHENHEMISKISVSTQLLFVLKRKLNQTYWKSRMIATN